MLPRAAVRRLLTFGGLLVAEYLVVSVIFDVRSLQSQPGPLAVLAYLGDAAAIVLLAGAGLLLLRGQVLAERMAEAVRAAPPPRVATTFLALHAVAYVTFLALSARVLAERVDPSVATMWLVPWLLAGVLWIALLVPAALPISAARLLFSSGVGTLALAGAIGLLIWSLGIAGEMLWPVLRGPTIDSAAWLLARVSQEGVVKTADELFGTPAFVVKIAPECSGLEGMGLMVAFLGGFMVLHRRSLRLSRALWVLPVAVAVSWVANVVRLVVLVLIGAHVSEDVAVGGFHSKAGWFLFCLLAFAFIVGLRRSTSVWRETPVASAPMTEDAAPYLLPLLSLLAMALVTGLFSTGFDAFYGARVAAGAIVLWVYRRNYASLLVRPSWEAIAIGVAVFALWIALVPRHAPETAPVLLGLAELSGAAAIAWIALRVVGSVLLVPIAEELAFRGYLLRRLINADFGAVSYASFHAAAFVISSVAFGLLHSQPLAGTLAGMAYALAQQRRGRLSDAVAAHAVTNALIAGDVLVNGAWGLW